MPALDPDALPPIPLDDLAKVQAFCLANPGRRFEHVTLAGLLFDIAEAAGVTLFNHSDVTTLRAVIPARPMLTVDCEKWTVTL